MSRRSRKHKRGPSSKPGFVYKPTHVLCPKCCQDYLIAYLAVMVETYYDVIYTSKRRARIVPGESNGTHEQEYVLGCGSCDFSFAYDSKIDLEEDVDDFVKGNNHLIEGSVPAEESTKTKVKPLKALLKKAGVMGDACN